MLRFFIDDECGRAIAAIVAALFFGSYGAPVADAVLVALGYGG